ncbi:tol-pal system YbgF family protein [Massilia sp. BJB1822]|uniref:tetratricopeptide repeat protein n=1 Tax=Massilia sp. BJB1822 TaxID=2744470 RepID=UPI001593C4FA|nr:tetratricopeptide repeat protein [Massilia sp. BJB1822]NVE01398.1 tetratricopeptide repeat protein [Massilia sp. BJB1822]
MRPHTPHWLLAGCLALALPAQARLLDTSQPALAGATTASTAADLAEAEAADRLPLQQEELYRAAMRALAEGHQQEASELLLRLIDKEPRHAGAWLELAITQCELGNSVEAERLFQEVETRFDPPPGIVEVIVSHRASGCRGKPVREPSWMLSLGRGRDNNVNQGASNPFFSFDNSSDEFELAPEFRPRADNYKLLSASYLRPMNNKGTLGIVQLYARQHDRMHEQDSASLLAGLEHSASLGRWRTRATLAAGVVSLDHALYQRQLQAQLRAAPPIKWPENYDLALSAGLTKVRYPTRATYDATTTELGAVLSYRTRADQVQASFSGQRDHGETGRPGGDRQGWFGSVQWYTALQPGWYGEVGLTHQYWKSETAYLPGRIEQTRRQNTTTLRAAVQWYLQANYSLHLEWRETRNRENISLFQYNSRALQLSLRWDNF